MRRRWPLEFGAGDLATERVPVGLDFYVTPVLWREKKATVPKEVLLVCSSLSFHLPSPLFPCPHALPLPPAPLEEATLRPGSQGQRLLVLKSQPYLVLGEGWEGQTALGC